MILAVIQRYVYIHAYYLLPSLDILDFLPGNVKSSNFGLQSEISARMAKVIVTAGLLYIRLFKIAITFTCSFQLFLNSTQRKLYAIRHWTIRGD